MFSPATGAFEGSGGSLRRSFSLTGGRVLHAGTHLLTVMRLSAERLLVRLAHLMDVGEDPSLGAPMTEDLGRLLGPFGCSGRFVEMSLTGNQRRSDAEKRRLVFTAGEALGGKDTVSGCKASQVATGDSCGDDCTENGGAGLVRLQPMEIRTFEVAC